MEDIKKAISKLCADICERSDPTDNLIRAGAVLLLVRAENEQSKDATPGPAPRVDNVFHAAGIVKACCDSHDGCTKCELLAVCAARSPHLWRDPEVGV